jgi:hypothetical protein
MAARFESLTRSLSEAVARTDERVADLASSAALAQRQLSELQVRFTDFCRDVDLAGISSEFDAIRSSVRECEDRIFSVETAVRELPLSQFQNDIASLQAGVRSAIESEVASRERLSAEIAELKSRARAPPGSPDPSAFQIFARLYRGGSLTLTVRPTDSIGDLKQQIATQDGLPPEMQRLVYRNHILRDDATVADCRLERGSFVSVECTQRVASRTE